MLELVRNDLKIPFLSWGTPVAIFSAIICGLSLYFIVTKGFNYGVDFAGGIQMIVKYPESTGVDAEMVRKSLSDMGLKEVSVQGFGTEFADREGSEFVIHITTDFTNPEVVKGELSEKIKSLSIQMQDFKFSGLEKGYLTLSGAISLADLRQALVGTKLGLLEIQDVHPFGRESSGEYEVIFKNLTQHFLDHWQKAFPSQGEDVVTIQQMEFVGAKVGKDLRTSALISIIMTLALIFMYIFVRFEFIFAPGAILALAHDILVTLGFFSITGMTFDLTVVAALLTIAGFSINDTIVIYDRIREVMAQMKGKSLEDIFNLSINQTFSRTIITSGTVFLAVVTMLIFGGPVIQPFAAAMTVGVVSGTYSTVFIASFVTLRLENLLKKSASQRKRVAA